MRPKQNSLDILVNTPTPLQFGTYSIEATPLTTGELPAVLAKIGHLLPLLQAVHSAADVAALLADHGDALIEAAAIAARLPLDQVQALAPDECVELMFGLIEVNVDFFVQRMTRLTGRAVEARARMEALAAHARAAAATLPGTKPSPG